MKKVILGIFYYANGDKYDGEWVNGAKNGYGTLLTKHRNVLLW